MGRSLACYLSPCVSGSPRNANHERQALQDVLAFCSALRNAGGSLAVMSVGAVSQENLNIVGDTRSGQEGSPGLAQGYVLTGIFPKYQELPPGQGLDMLGNKGASASSIAGRAYQELSPLPVPLWLQISRGAEPEAVLHNPRSQCPLCSLVSHCLGFSCRAMIHFFGISRV